MDRGSINNNNNNTKKDNIVIYHGFLSFIDTNTDTNTTTKKDYIINYHGFELSKDVGLFVAGIFVGPIIDFSLE